MSRKRKSAHSDLCQVVEKISANEITFDSFFNLSLANGLVKHWQQREIHAFFRTLGLKDKELIDSYKDALSKY